MLAVLNADLPCPPPPLLPRRCLLTLQAQLARMQVGLLLLLLLYCHRAAG